ncbi:MULTISPECIES: hypothetical protein [Sorangium]
MRADLVDLGERAARASPRGRTKRRAWSRAGARRAAGGPRAARGGSTMTT